MRVYNFSSGPAKLPEEVLRQASEEMLSWHGRGYSIMETSHRSQEFTSIIAETEQLLRTLLGIPDNYSVLLLQGGAHLQFADAKLDSAFLTEGEQQGLAMPVDGVRALVDFMQDFERRHG